MIRGELAVAAIFIVSTLISLYRFRIQKRKVTVLIWNVIVNILAYIYQVYESSCYLVDSIMKDDNSRSPDEETSLVV